MSRRLRFIVGYLVYRITRGATPCLTSAFYGHHQVSLQGAFVTFERHRPQRARRRPLHRRRAPWGLSGWNREIRAGEVCVAACSVAQLIHKTPDMRPRRPAASVFSRTSLTTQPLTGPGDRAAHVAAPPAAGARDCALLHRPPRPPRLQAPPLLFAQVGPPLLSEKRSGCSHAPRGPRLRELHRTASQRVSRDRFRV